MSGEKRHPATLKKLEKARREGKVSKSQTFTLCFQVIGVSFGTFLAVQFFWSTPEILLKYKYSWNVHGASEWFRTWMTRCLLTVGVAVGGGAVASIAGEFLQVGMLVSLKPLVPDVKRMNPSQAIQRMGRGVLESWLMGVKFIAILLATAVTLQMAFVKCTQLLGASRVVIESSVFAPLKSLGVVLFGVLLLLAGVEKLYRRYRFLKDQRMSDQELRMEHKDAEGDPHIRARQRSLRDEIAFSDLKKRVKRARVVIVKRNQEA